VPLDYALDYALDWWLGTEVSFPDNEHSVGVEIVIGVLRTTAT